MTPQLQKRPCRASLVTMLRSGLLALLCLAGACVIGPQPEPPTIDDGSNAAVSFCGDGGLGDGGTADSGPHRSPLADGGFGDGGCGTYDGGVP